MIDYIIFTGPDCSGKSHMANKLYNNLQKQSNELNKEIDLLLTCEPFKDKSFKCNNLSLYSKLFIYNEQRKFYTDRILNEEGDMYENFMEDRKLNLKSLQYIYDLYNKNNKNLIIIQDRSYFSTIIYQHLMFNLSVDKILNDHVEIFQKYPDIKPNILIFTEASENVLLKRLHAKEKIDNLDSYFLKNIETIIKNYHTLKKLIEQDRLKYLLKKDTEILTFTYNE